MVRHAWLAGVLALALAACGGSRERGPAWPKPSPSETDGGESLAPRQASSVAAIEESDDEAPSDATPSAPAPTAPAAATTAPAVKPAETPPPSEPDPLTTEEIIIEIDD
jgi:hypothetical protein